jgi:hypothetical protein
MQSLRVERRPESILRVARTGLEDILSLINDNHRIFESSILLIGVSLFFYQVRELLICWLFFSVPFVLLALLLFAGVVAYNAGQYFVHWAGKGIRVTAREVPVREARHVLRCRQSLIR